MPSYNPTITNNTTSFLQVTSSNVSYEEIKESFAANSYKVEMIYVASPLNLAQIQQSYQYQHFDSNGNQIYENLIFPIDPYQRQATIFQEEENKSIVFDGRSSLAFPIEPLTAAQYKFFYRRVDKAAYLNKLHKNNFVDLEDTMMQFDFFDGLNDIIPDE